MRIPRTLRKSLARYRRAFARARALRSWRSFPWQKGLGAAALAAAIPTTAPGQFPAVFELSSLDGTNGFVINGANTQDFSGVSVSGAGDFNGDGIDDVIIGAFGPNNFAGASYVVFGKGAFSAASLDLRDLNGTNGLVINGVDTSDVSGVSVSGAGDVNGDGIDDVIIGAPLAYAAGESYVVFGKNTPFSASIELGGLNGVDGFVINGVDSADDSGRSVSGAGDINGDGIDDLIIGANLADPNGDSAAGESYVLFGRNAPFTSSIDLSGLSGPDGFTINGIDPDDYSGYSVSGAGDVNGDGIDDLIIGARNADPNSSSTAGESYVVFGKTTPFAASLELSELNGADGFVVNGIGFSDNSGRSVSGAGDINGDGIDDLIIGAYDADSKVGFEAGESYVVFGKSTPFSASLELSGLSGSDGFRINGVDGGDQSGFAVSGAGDINGDGIDDLIIGAPEADPFSTGESYVVFGRDTTDGSSMFTPSLDLGTLSGSDGFVIEGIDGGDQSGISVSGAGDVNGDGIDDLIIGAYGADPDFRFTAGESYVVFGRRVTIPGDTDGDGDIDLVDLDTLGANFGVVGATDGASIGDFDGDGDVDLVDLDTLGRGFGQALSPVPGDADGDGDIDLVDLDALGANFGVTGSNGGASIGDFDGDGDVDLVDLDTLGANFGSGTPMAVPEPTAALTAASGLLAWFSRRRR